ncbi:MAG: class I SAM-dependent methyltransferase [Ignavibacteriales bacterium]|nr:MAG: class I SAM-dependent methyltransferase [Ignavibacteriales bacterium]
MEVKEINPAWLDESHPNFNRWKRAREVSIERGKFVSSIINQQLDTKDLSVLDLGSGEGGTSKVFSENNFIVSFDLSLIRLQRQISSVISKEGFYPTEKSSTNNKTRFLSSFEMTEPELVNGSALQLPFTNNSFDLIIIQDVIEHLTDMNGFYSEVKRVLKNKGTIYLSTPNKLSVFNFLSDPHFGLPVLSLLKRQSIKKYFLKQFRKDDYNRPDIAQLLSLNELLNLFNSDYEISLYTKFSVQELFNGNKGMVWSDFHLKLITFCKLIKIDWLIIKLSNDKIGIINKYFTPTFYFTLCKK